LIGNRKVFGTRRKQKERGCQKAQMEIFHDLKLNGQVLERSSY